MSHALCNSSPGACSQKIMVVIRFDPSGWSMSLQVMITLTWRAIEQHFCPGSQSFDRCPSFPLFTHCLYSRMSLLQESATKKCHLRPTHVRFQPSPSCLMVCRWPCQMLHGFLVSCKWMLVILHIRNERQVVYML